MEQKDPYLLGFIFPPIPLDILHIGTLLESPGLVCWQTTTKLSG